MAQKKALICYYAVNLAGKNIAVKAIPRGIVETDGLNHFSIMVSDKVF